MLPEIEKLLVIQDRDRKIRTLKQELKIGPLEKKEMDDRLAAALKELEAVRQKSREIEVERKKLENEAQSKRDSIAKFQTQKFQTRKNEEFQALSNEIKRFENDIQGIEDRELDLMENAEKVKALAAETDRQTQATKALVARQITDLADKTQAVTEQLKELETERATLAAGVDEELLDTFNRLFTNKTEAVVALEPNTVAWSQAIRFTAPMRGRRG
jgi:predicted  nucleic acid-binding Zn-ribbon protein